MLHFSQVAAAT